MSGTIAYGDEIEKYRVAQSLVERGDISFRPTAVRNIASPDGRTISLYELGQTLLQIPFYAAGKFLNLYLPTADPNHLPMLVVGLVNPFLSALTCVVLYESGRIVGFRARTALTLNVMYGLASIAWPYAHSYTREPLLTLALFSATSALFQFEKTRAYRWALIAGLAAGYLVFSKFIQASVVPFLLIYAAVAARRSYRAIGWRDAPVRAKMLAAVLVFLSPILLFLVVQAFYSWARFGTVLAGYSTKVNPVEWILFLISHSHPHLAAFGLLFSPEKSYWLYNPLTLLCLGAIPLWWKRRPLQAALVLALVGVEFLAVIMRPDWDGGTWWGPRYLVQLTPLLILSLGFVLESSWWAVARAGQWGIGVLFGVSVFVQLLGSLGSGRDFLDMKGVGITMLGQLDLLRYGLLDSLFIYLPPTGLPININPALLTLGAFMIALGLALSRQWACDTHCLNAPRRSSVAWISVVLVAELGALTVWIVAPYPRVLTAQANTRFTAAERLLAAERTCEARMLYHLALDRGTTFQRQAIARYEQLTARPAGIVLTANDLTSQIEMANSVPPEIDYLTALTPEGALKLHLPGERDATIMLTSTPIAVTPNTRYELSGWWKTLNVYGTRYASIALYQDDGAWQAGHGFDIASLDETHGWQLFQRAFTTLPTTQRVMIKVALWQTHGTVWVDDVRLVANPSPAPACK